MPPDDVHRMLIVGSFMDVTEIESYRRLFADLAGYETKQSGATTIGDLLPRLYAAGADTTKDRRGYFLMLEDVSPEYAMMDYNAGLGPDQLVRSLEWMAHFHAACYAMKQGEGFNSFAEKYRFWKSS